MDVSLTPRFVGLSVVILVAAFFWSWWLLTAIQNKDKGSALWGPYRGSFMVIHAIVAIIFAVIEVIGLIVGYWFAWEWIATWECSC